MNRYNKLITTEDIINLDKRVIIPKGSVVEESIDFDNWILHCDLLFAKAASKLRSRKALVEMTIPDVYRIMIPCKQCKFSKVPWFNKVRAVTFEDREYLDKVEEKVNKYWEIYDAHKQAIIEQDTPTFQRWVRKLETFIADTTFPNGLIVSCDSEDTRCRISIRRFANELAVIYFQKYYKESVQTQYKAIIKFLKNL